MNTNMNRYLRNIQIEKVGETGQQKLFDAKILVCGAGGLGSTVISNLSAAGVGHLGLVDVDTVEITNLNRQYIHKYDNIGKDKVESAKEWINAFNPDIDVKIYPVKLDEENYCEIVKDYDIIIDCFDSYASKFLLNEIAVTTKKTLVHGGVTEFGGQVTTIIPNETACLNCLFETPENSQWLPQGVISPAVSTIASIQAYEAIKFILNLGEQLKNRLLYFDGLKMTFKELKISKNRHCPLCGFSISSTDSDKP